MMPHPPALVRHLAVATLLMGFGPIPAHAQAAESCQDAARTREREIQQQYLEELKGCRGSRGTECTGPVTRRAQDRHRESDRELAACVAGERARDDGVIRAEEILTPDGRRLLFQLGAEMDVIVDQRRQAGPGDPFGEFVTGLAEWAGSTIGFLAQRPGAPVEQMAQGILDYLTTDTAENHRMLQAAAEQGVRDFQQNPARFLGRNLPDLIPVPGGAANEVRALQRVQQVEKAAERIKKMADAEKRLAGLYEKVGPPPARIGAEVQGDMCFAINSCVDTALAEAELFKTGGPIGDGTPWKIVGTRGLETPQFPDFPSGRPRDTFTRWDVADIENWFYFPIQ